MVNMIVMKANKDLALNISPEFKVVTLGCVVGEICARGQVCMGNT